MALLALNLHELRDAWEEKNAFAAELKQLEYDFKDIKIPNEIADDISLKLDAYSYAYFKFGFQQAIALLTEKE